MKENNLVLIPRMSEKAYAVSEQLRTYVFDVPKSANKNSIVKSVETQFEVNVEHVNIAVTKGKQKRTYRKSGRSVSGRRSDVKKAYVRVSDGQSIPIFEAVKEAEETKEKQSENVKKAMDKKAAKEAKQEAKQEEKPKKGIFSRRAPDRTSVRGNK